MTSKRTRSTQEDAEYYRLLALEHPDFSTIDLWNKVLDSGKVISCISLHRIITGNTFNANIPPDPHRTYSFYSPLQLADTRFGSINIMEVGFERTKCECVKFNHEFTISTEELKKVFRNGTIYKCPVCSEQEEVIEIKECSICSRPTKKGSLLCDFCFVCDKLSKQILNIEFSEFIEELTEEWE